MEENTRLSDLTRMLLSSPSFSGFLDTLASNPAAAQTAQAVQQPQQAEQVQQPQRVRKDINPYAAQQQQMQQQHIGMTMMPEQTMDFSMLDLNGVYPSYQPQVFSVLSLPETILDSETLSGKSSSFSPSTSHAEKVELPKIERMPVTEPEQAELSIIVDEEFDADPAFALYSAPVSTASEPKQDLDLSFLANLSIKPSQYELVTKTDDSASDVAFQRVERLARDMDACLERLMSLTMHL